MAKLPVDSKISGMLKDLVGKAVVCKEKKGGKLAGQVLWAHYQDQQSNKEAIWLWELPAGVSVGAALIMMPAGEANATIKKGTVDEVTLDNFREVCNVLVGLLNDEGGDVLFLKAVGTEDVKKGPMSEKAKGLDGVVCQISIEGYSGGLIQISRN